MSDLLQFKRLTSATITQTFIVDGVAADLDSGVPTVVITKPDGTTIASGTVSNAWAGPPARSTGQYRFVLAGQPDCTILTVTWAGTIGGQPQTLQDTVEIVGADLFTGSAFRALRVANGYPFALTAIPLYSDAQIRDTRTAVLDEFTTILGCSPVPRFARATLDGNGRTCLILPGLKATRVLSVTVNGAAKTATDYQIIPGNQIEAVTSYSYGTAFTGGRRNVTVEWVHGTERVEGNGSHVAMLYAAALLNPSGFSSASTVSMPDGSTYTYEPSETGRGGFQRFTGIRDVDRWLNRHSQSGFAVA
jgi:hypothetical protein